MKRETAKRLLDAQAACIGIQYFTTGTTIDTMRKERLLQRGLHKLLEIVGEALNQATKSDPTIALSIPDARRYVAMRNQIVHGYDSVDYTIIRQVCTERIPSLAAALDMLLADTFPDSDAIQTEPGESN